MYYVLRVRNKSELYIVQSLLAFTLYALQSSIIENVRTVITGHFGVADISEAKQELWRCCGGSDMPRRRESTARPLEEANTQDIITALCKLDKARQLPNIMAEAFSMDKIPRWQPEEQNQICLADRMLRLENRVTRLQEAMDNNMAENMVLKEKMDCMKERDNTYADMVKGQSPTHRSPVLTKQIHKDNNQSDVNVQQDQPLQEQNEKNYDDAPINNTTDIGTERNVDDKPTATWRGRGNQRGRGSVRGHDRDVADVAEITRVNVAEV